MLFSWFSANLALAGRVEAGRGRRRLQHHSDEEVRAERTVGYRVPSVAFRDSVNASRTKHHLPSLARNRHRDVLPGVLRAGAIVAGLQGDP